MAIIVKLHDERANIQPGGEEKIFNYKLSRILKNLMKIVARGFLRRSFHQKDQDERQEEE
jgi:DNA-binding MarR family transcriptional regulator